MGTVGPTGRRDPRGIGPSKQYGDRDSRAQRVSMPTSDAPVLPPDVLRALQDRYRGTVASTLDLLRGMARVLSATPTAPETLDALRRELHRVHGTAGSYGYDLASRVAATLEACVIRWSVDPLLDRDERAAVVDRFVAELEAAFKHDEPAEHPPAR